jgi:hypothetical protein
MPFLGCLLLIKQMILQPAQRKDPQKAAVLPAIRVWENKDVQIRKYSLLLSESVSKSQRNIKQTLWHYSLQGEAVSVSGTCFFAIVRLFRFFVLLRGTIGASSSRAGTNVSGASGENRSGTGNIGW